MREIETQGLRNMEALESQKFQIVDFSSGVADLSFKTPMLLPFGEVSHRPSGILSVHLKIGNNILEGSGEGATLSSALFTDDYGGSIGNSISEIVKTMSDRSFDLSQAYSFIQNYEFQDLRRAPTSRMTVEMAIIDALAKYFGKSVGEILGLRSNSEVKFGKSIGASNKAGILAQVEETIEANAKKVKLKISPSTSEEVIESIDEVKKTFPEVEIMVDANGTFDPAEDSHLRTLMLLDEKGLIMIEEPVSRTGATRGISAVRILRNKLPSLKTPICLDDCLVDLDTTEEALKENLADVVNIKPGRIGSIISAIGIAEICRKMGKQIMVGGMFEATPGRIMTTTLAGYFHTLGFNIPGDLSLAQDRLSEDLVDQDQQLQIGPNGGILLPNGKGWGFTFKEGLLNER